MEKSVFLHVEFGPEPVLVNFEVYIDGGLYFTFTLTKSIIAFQRFDSYFLNISLAQMFRAIAFEDIKRIRNINEFIDRFMGKAGIIVIENRRKNRNRYRRSHR